jgi:prepilin-type N-terminal cleavage/methylation domain-containing protein
LPQVKSRAAFTLVEILVVLAVIAMLAALAMGGASRMLESAAISKSASQMLQLGRTAHSWAADNNGCLPTAGQPAIWYEEIYSYIYNTNAPSPFFQPFDKADNLRGTVFWCPLRDRFDEGPNKRSYGWNTYVKDMTKPDPRPPLAIARVKQPTKTMMLATSKNGSVLNGNSTNTWNLSDRCGGQVLIVFIDGHLEKWAMTNIPSSNTNVFWSPE